MPEELETDEEQIWLELDAQTRVEGFDKDGVATIAEGEKIAVSARLCEGHGEPVDPLADVIRPS